MGGKSTPSQSLLRRLQLTPPAQDGSACIQVTLPLFLFSGIKWRRETKKPTGCLSYKSYALDCNRELCISLLLDWVEVGFGPVKAAVLKHTTYSQWSANTSCRDERQILAVSEKKCPHGPQSVAQNRKDGNVEQILAELEHVLQWDAPNRLTPVSSSFFWFL